MSVLLLRCVAPMQSWGSRSRFDIRDTEREPTKSGVIGLLCAALGKPRDEVPNDGYPPLETLAALKMAVRVDREGVVRRDYQTAGGGSWGVKRYGVAKADGSTPAPVTSIRYCLSDAAFLVGLEGPTDLLERLNRAVRAPVWPMFFGRKAYPPGEPVALRDGLRIDAEVVDTLESYPLFQPTTRPLRESDSELVRFVVECGSGESGDPRQDVPLSFRLGNRQFAVRHVREYFRNRTEFPTEDSPCTLSLLTLQLVDRHVQRLLADPYTLHQALMRGLPTPAGRMLYRIEPAERKGNDDTQRVLVQSEDVPDWSALSESVHAQTKLFEPHLHRNTRLRFRLRTNPTVKKKRADRKHGAREGVIGETEQLEWLHRKAHAGGFSVIDCVVIDEGMVRGRKTNGHTMSFRSVRFEGHLTVTDETAFAQTLSSGVGSGKAFGFGLLSIAPA